MSEELKRTCCFINQEDSKSCENLAQWEIWTGDSADDFTDSCTQHVGEMLSDVPEIKIYPLEQ